MTENVALIKKKQKSFSKSIEKTKDKIKKGDIKISEKTPKRFKRSFKGLVYVSNIPHGFYREQLKGYFGQFGSVLKVRVGRSKKTGNSKGHAYVLFKDQEVAKIAAETMNNYLMDKRIIKAKFMPEDKKTKGLFQKSSFSKEHYPTLVRRLRFKKAYNATVPEEKEIKKTKKALKHIENVAKKLKEIGIDYDFKPVNVPKLFKTVEETDIADDSSSEDIIFTSPEEMKNKSKELTEVKFKTDKNRGPSGSKKVKKGINKNPNDTEDLIKSTLQKKKQNKNKQSQENKNKKNNSKDELNNTNENNKNINKKNKNTLKKDRKEIKSTLAKVKKQKNQNINNLENIDNNTNENNTKLHTKQKKEKKNSFGNTEGNSNDNNENLEKEKQKKKKDEKHIKKQIKKKLKNKISRTESLQNDVSNKIVGVIKKSKKSLKTAKISDKKAKLIKNQIKESDQVKTIKQIEKKKSPGIKKNKTIFN